MQVKLLCPECGSWSTCIPRSLLLRVVFSASAAEGLITDTTGGARDYLDFPCGGRCQGRRRRHVQVEEIRWLLLCGVPVSVVEVPAEALDRPVAGPLTEAEVDVAVAQMDATDYLVQERRPGKGFSSDDVLVWHLTMQRTDYLAAVAAVYTAEGLMPPGAGAGEGR